MNDERDYGSPTIGDYAFSKVEKLERYVASLEVRLRELEEVVAILRRLALDLVREWKK